MTFDGRIEAQFFVPSGVVVTATNGGAGKPIPMPANGYYLSDFVALLQTQLNTYSDSAAWTIALSIGANGTGQVTINCTGTFSLAFTNVEIRQLLGFAADIVGATTPQIGAAQARSLWIPDCPVAVDGDPRTAPPATDLRQTQSPTGAVLGLVGNQRFVHNNVRWTAVPFNRTWTVLEVLANQSMQSFLRDTQWAFGANELGLWFRPSSACRLYDLKGQLFGTNLAYGWALIGVDKFSPTMTKASYTGLWNIVIPSIVSRSGP